MEKLKSVDHKTELKNLENMFIVVNKEMLSAGFDINILRNSSEKEKQSTNFRLFTCFLLLCLSIVVQYCANVSIINIIIAQIIGTRCIFPNNYFIWEATRPISNCHYCLNVSKPIILPNISREEFAKYAYTSKPIIIKKAVSHWSASKHFNFNYLKKLYESTNGAYESVEEDCQFLHFNSDFTTLRDVFAMSAARANNSPGEKSWYVGWCNYNQEVLNKMRKYYSVPHFLPLDSEMSNKEYIFMGYNQGANMHLDFISRLMWQAQILGNKTWHLIPSPECENVCQSFSFYVEPGDAMLLDTRVWYHATTIAPGEFSLTIQSEYS